MPSLCRALLMVLTSTPGVAVMLGCDRVDDAPRTDSVTLVRPPTSTVDSQRPPASSSSGWDASAGPVLLVATERPEAAVVIFPDVQGEHAAAELHFDTTALRGATATLINRAGGVSTGTLGEGMAPTEDEECVGWPMVRVTSPAGSPSPWSIGLLGARLTAIPLDSVGSLSVADSSVLIVEVARLASTIPVREHAARLRGLPFFVRDVRQFRTTSGADVIIAHVLRRVHEEANPLEERTLLIAERDTIQRHDTRRRYALAFHQRMVGREETLEGSELLAALVHPGTLRPVLVLARESEGGVRYTLLERSGARTWRVQWMSALVRC